MRFQKNPAPRPKRGGGLTLDSHFVLTSQYGKCQGTFHRHRSPVLNLEIRNTFAKFALLIFNCIPGGANVIGGLNIYRLV